MPTLPTPTPIDTILDEIQAMNDKFTQPACGMAGEPMIKYPDTGTPPTISFNIPQATAFHTYGKMAVPLVKGTQEVPDMLDYFKDFTWNIPENNYWSTISKMTPDQIFQFINPYTAALPQPELAVAYAATPSDRPISLAEADYYKTHSISPADYGVARKLSAGPLIEAGRLYSLATEAPKKSAIADYASMGLRPVFINRLLGRGQAQRYIAQPPKPKPQLFIVEEYTTVMLSVKWRQE
jgi:hypothetical protein